MTRFKDTCHSKLMLMVLLTTVAVPIGCDKGAASAPPPQPDPWTAKLAQYKADYEANEAKLSADWRAALQDAKAGDLDADKLSADIAELTRQVNDDRNKLEDWNRAISEQLVLRGVKPVTEADIHVEHQN